MFKLLFALLILVGCQKYSQVTTELGQSTMTIEDAGLAQVKIEDWHVGPLRRQKLSMGVRIKIDFPRVQDSDVERLAKKHGFDSWLISLSRSSLGRKERLGTFYSPLFKTSARSGGGVANSKHGYIDFFYAAASISTRLRELACPALKHRFELNDVTIRDSTLKPGLLVIGPMQEQLFMGRAEKLEFQRNIINGGMTLSGEYEVSLSLYNAQTNRVHSNEVTLPQTLVIGSESFVTIRGCENVQTPTLEESERSIQQFKFGQ